MIYVVLGGVAVLVVLVAIGLIVNIPRLNAKVKIDPSKKEVSVGTIIKTKMRSASDNVWFTQIFVKVEGLEKPIIAKSRELQKNFPTGKKVRIEYNRNKPKRGNVLDVLSE